MWQKQWLRVICTNKYTYICTIWKKKDGWLFATFSQTLPVRKLIQLFSVSCNQGMWRMCVEHEPFCIRGWKIFKPCQFFNPENLNPWYLKTYYFIQTKKYNHFCLNSVYFYVSCNQEHNNSQRRFLVTASSV